MSDAKIIGINTRHVPVGGTHGWHRQPMTVVLVAGEIGDYAAYMGLGGAQDIAAFGDKISFIEACIHFPGGQLEEKKYRT